VTDRQSRHRLSEPRPLSQVAKLERMQKPKDAWLHGRREGRRSPWDNCVIQAGSAQPHKDFRTAQSTLIVAPMVMFYVLHNSHQNLMWNASDL